MIDRRSVAVEPAERVSARVGDRTSYDLYLREAAETPLLTRSEEVSLARKIRRGDAEARDRMIRANLRLVVKIARDYEGYGLPLLDLISEGNIGLVMAVERYNPNRGAKLSTYASWWIKLRIKRALSNQTRTIRLPVHAFDRMVQISQAAGRLATLLGRQPTDDEVAQELGMALLLVKRYRRSSAVMASLDAPLNEGESGSLADLIPDERKATPDQEFAVKSDLERLRRLLGELSPRERAILEYRFGLEDREERTLEQVGVKFGVTRERIRQLQEMALQKLRRLMEKQNSIGLAA